MRCSPPERRTTALLNVNDADAATRSVGVVVVAAGSGARLGGAVPKAFAVLGGRPLLAHVLDTLAGWPRLGGLVVVVPPGWVDVSTARWHGIDVPRGTRVVRGGTDRTASVRCGLEALETTCDVVLVHDAARCLTPISVFDRVADAVGGAAAGVVPGVPVVDTVKIVDGTGHVLSTPDRAMVRAVQTPQGFDRSVLEAAHDAGLASSDDAALVERLGHRVLVVPGDVLALKITTPDDLAVAERHLTGDGGRAG
jgi:2-C-methyl-D-erythritol 4-phosphate cytidylyltransferase